MARPSASTTAHKASMAAAASASAALDALALDLRLQPGVALGPFTLGIPLWHTLDYLRSNPTHFPKVQLVLPAAPPPAPAPAPATTPAAPRAAAVAASGGAGTGASRKKAASSSPPPAAADADSEGTQAILVSVLPHLHLVFSAHSQRLQLITFNLVAPPSGRDPSYRPVRIAYNRSVVFDSTPLLVGPSSSNTSSSSSAAATAAAGASGSSSASGSSPSSSLHALPPALTHTSIHQTFGPTYPPRRLAAQDEFVVSYPGLAFTFPAPTSSKSTSNDSSSAGQAKLDKHYPAAAFHIFAGHDLLRPAHILLPPANAHMLPSYPPPSTSASSSAARLGGPAAQHGAAGGQGAVPPACLKAVVRPGHSVNLHLFAHPPTQPLALGSHTAYLTPTALVNSITSDNNPATSSSSSSSAADSVRNTPPAEYPHGHRTLTLVLGQTTTQDVLAELGAPQRRFGKVDERLGIHSFAAAASAAAAAAALSSVGGSGRRTDGNAVELARRRMWKAGAALGADGAEFEEGEAMNEVHDNPEFWNYFDLGIDLLFATPALTPAAVASSGGGNANGAQSVQPGLGKGAGAGGVLLKVIVHSNVPGSALFQRYHRCPWVVVPAVPSSSVGSGAGKRKAEVSFHESLDDLSALLSPLSSSAKDNLLTTAGEGDDRDEHRIELDRASDADFLPPSSAASRHLSSSSSPSSAATVGSGLPREGASAAAEQAGAGIGAGKRGASATAAAARSGLKLDVRTWLYGFENHAAVEDEEEGGDDVPEGGLIAEADEAGRMCSVLIY